MELRIIFIINANEDIQIYLISPESIILTSIHSLKK